MTTRIDGSVRRTDTVWAERNRVSGLAELHIIIEGTEHVLYLFADTALELSASLLDAGVEEYRDKLGEARESLEHALKREAEADQKIEILQEMLDRTQGYR